MRALEPGTSVGGRYIVEACIGRGGMGLVYRVRHEALGTLHALKVLLSSTPIIRERLQMEGRAQAAMHHPNLVSVTDWIVIDGAPGLVMEYVRGPSLEVLLGDRRLETPQIDALAAGMLDGVAAAHAHRVVHRDLKPANVLLGVTPTALVPKVTDFGLVKLLADDEDDHPFRTRPGIPMGTPAYMAPEQIRDPGTVDVRADVWSLGAVLFEIVTGSRAFPETDPIVLYGKIGAGQRASVRDLAPHAPQRWIRAVDGALVTDRDRRIGSVRELRAIWLDGSSPVADPWGAIWIERATELGAGGLSASAFLRRSLRSQPSRPSGAAQSSGPTHVAEETSSTPGALDDPRQWVPVASAVVVLGVAGLAAGVLGSLAVAGTWWALSGDTPERVTPVIAQPREPEVRPEPTPAPEPEPEPEPIPTPEPQPTPRPRAPDPVSAPRKPKSEATLAVAVTGLTVMIVGPDGKAASAGVVRPGKYVVHGIVDDNGVWESQELLDVELAAGERATVTCDPGGCVVTR